MLVLSWDGPGLVEPHVLRFEVELPDAPPLGVLLGLVYALGNEGVFVVGLSYLLHVGVVGSEEIGCAPSWGSVVVLVVDEMISVGCSRIKRKLRSCANVTGVDLLSLL